MLVNFHKQPPNYDIQLAYGIIPYLKWGLLMHILFANAMFGNKSIFSTQPYYLTDVEGNSPKTEASSENVRGVLDRASFVKQVEDYEERYLPGAYFYMILGTVGVIIVLY